MLEVIYILYGHLPLIVIGVVLVVDFIEKL
jgi:hypothetical protein